MLDIVPSTGHAQYSSWPHMLRTYISAIPHLASRMCYVHIYRTHAHTQDSADCVQQKISLVLIKFLQQLYETLPQFASFAKKADFIEAQVATLFPPLLRGGVGEPVSAMQVTDAEDEVSACACVCACLELFVYCVCMPYIYVYDCDWCTPPHAQYIRT